MRSGVAVLLHTEKGLKERVFNQGAPNPQIPTLANGSRLEGVHGKCFRLNLLNMLALVTNLLSILALRAREGQPHRTLHPLHEAHGGEPSALASPCARRGLIRLQRL